MTSQYVYSVSTSWKTIYGIIALFSMICSLVIPLVYYISKKAQLHPSKILVFISIFEMISCYHLMIWAMDLDNFLYFFRYYQLIDWFLFGHGGTIQKDNYIECYQNKCLYFLSLYFEFCYYIFLNIDLIITIKRPFISGKSRMKKYHIISFIVSIILFAFTVSKFHELCSEKSKNKKQDMDSPYLFIAYDAVLVIQFIFYFFGILSICLGVQSLKRTSKTSADIMKRQYIYNHILAVIIFSILWALPVINNMLLNFNLYYELLNNICFCILLSQGMILASLRLKDHFYRNRLKYFILSFFSETAKLKSQNMDNEEDDDQINQAQDGWNCSLGAILNQIQNQSIVQSMLQGVITIILMEPSSEGQTLLNNQVLKKWIKEKYTKSLIATHERDSILTSQEEPFIPKEIKSIRMTEYAPQVFQLLRGYDNYTVDIIMSSLEITQNEKQIKQSQQSMGKSGSFFFFSYDKKFILKTLRGGELSTLLDSVLYNYVLYISVYQQTLLAKLYGIFTVEIEGISPINLILMENSLGKLEQFGEVSRTYDLKGSLVHRYVKTTSFDQSQLELKSGSFDHKKQCNIIPLKDKNFLEQQDLFIKIDYKNRQNLDNQLKKDCTFLNENNLMDYSLLLGISQSNNSKGQDKNCFRCLEDQDGQLLSFCIIDYLQQFNFLKYLENRYKSLMKSEKTKKLISCVMPKQYSDRFYVFINSLIAGVINY